MSGHSLSVWNENVHAVCGKFETRYDHCHSLFIGELKRSVLGRTDVAHIRSNASSIAKSRRAERGNEPHCFLVLQQQGEMAIEVGDRVLDMREGDMALLDSAQAMKMVPQGLFAHVSIHLPREPLHKLERARFGKLSSTGACGQMLGTLVRQIASGDLAHWACAEDGDGPQAALVALLGSVLDYRAREDSPGLVLHEVQSLIQQRLDSPRLTPVSLARELGISSRQLYRLFETSGDSVCRYILRERLMKAAQDLRNPAYSHRSITEIGTCWGFVDSAHFSKTFKKQLGMTPRGYRNQGM